MQPHLVLLPAVLSLAALACTGPDRPKEPRRREEPPTGATEPAPIATKTLKLKSTEMIAQSLFVTLGPGKTLKRDESGATRDLMVDFRRNFGGTSSLRLGEVYADSPSVAYVLALGVVGMNAGTVCKEQLDKADPDAAKCACTDAASAAAMVGRALPFLDMTRDDARAVVDELAAQCAKDPAGAIGALVSSLAFAARR